MADVSTAADTADVQPAAKRAKTGPGDAGTAKVIRQSLLSDDSRQQLRKQHDTSGPYTHLVLKDLCEPELLRAVREEVIHNISATYKETDLFKVFQTGDLANMDSLDPESAAKLPSLMKLRDAIYSTDFRKFVEDITGVGDLSDKTDLSCNVYAQGGHLLNHDDVIGTRAVSFIIYLTDPEEPWRAEDGGALELYPLLEGKPHTPDVIPATCHLPVWNTMAMFIVQPGKSFHSVQEVLSAEKPRFSISGWYHKGKPQEGSEHASLQQLQMKAGEDQISQHHDFEGGNTAADLSEADLAVLRRWINPAYLKPEAWAKIQAKMEADGSVQLQKFLADGISCQVLAAVVAQDKVDCVGGGKIPPFKAGYSEDWEAVGPPHKQRYLRYKGKPVQPAVVAAAASANGDANGAAAAAAEENGTGTAGADAGALLCDVQHELFESGAFARLLKCMTDVEILKHAGEVRRFRAGLDYTVAHYGIITSAPRLDCVLSFVDDSSPEAADNWAVGEVGGFEAYLLADDDEGEAAAVYRQTDNDNGVINVPAASNCLNLLMRDAGLMRFVKYISAAAPGSRWDVAMEYVPEDDGVDPPMPEEPAQDMEQDGAAAADAEAAAAAGE